MCLINTFDFISISQTQSTDRVFSTVHHRCFLPHKTLQSVRRYQERKYCPVSQNECTHSEWWMTIPFKLVHVSARERLHACLRFKLVHVAENVKQRPWGHIFRWVAEFGVTPLPTRSAEWWNCSSAGGEYRCRARRNDRGPCHERNRQLRLLHSANRL